MTRNFFKLTVIFLLGALTVVYTNCGVQFGGQTKLTFKSNVLGGSDEASVNAFEKTVYPITRAHCIACHTTTQPTHAADNVKVAHDAVISNFKVNFANIPSSRLVAKLRDDKHNCWSDCTQDSMEMQTAIEDWWTDLQASAPPTTTTGGSAGGSSGGSPGGTITGIQTTSSRALAVEFTDAGNPPKTNSVLLTADTAMLTPPMVKATSATDGTYVYVPNNGTEATLTAGAAGAGKANLNFKIVTAGTFRVWGEVIAPNTNDNAFFVRIPTSPTPGFMNFDIATLSPNPNWRMLGQTYNLAPGNYTIELSQKKDGTKLTKLLLTTDTNFMGINAADLVGITLSYDISTLTGVAGASFKIDIVDYDLYTYKVTKPRIVSPNGSIYVKGIKLYVNGVYNPQHSTYTIVDKIATPTDGLLSTYAMIVLKDQGVSTDKLAFGFDVLQKSNGTGGTLTSLESFQANVYPISRNNCASCHASGQMPYHASANVQTAHDIFVSYPLASFLNPDDSEIVKKLRVSRHNCGTPANCDAIALQYVNAITTWKKSRP